MDPAIGYGTPWSDASPPRPLVELAPPRLMEDVPPLPPSRVIVAVVAPGIAPATSGSSSERNAPQVWSMSGSILQSIPFRLDRHPKTSDVELAQFSSPE